SLHSCKYFFIFFFFFQAEDGIRDRNVTGVQTCALPISLYDLLFSENLSKQDIQKIKQVAVDLLAKVKAKIAELDHWTDKQETKAVVDNLIRDTLWAELPECYDEVSISGYRQRIYEYVYTRYPDVA